MFKRFFSLFLFVLMGVPLLAMDRHNSYQDQMRERQEQVRRYHELQNAARNPQRAPQAPRITQEQLDAQLALQLAQELEQEPQGGPNQLQERQQREYRERLQQEARDRAQAEQLQRQLDEQLARQLEQQEREEENRIRLQAQLQERNVNLARERQNRLQQERTQAQIQADAELARRLQEEAGLALARQLQAEQERDYAAYMQYHQDEQSEDEESYSDGEEYDEEDAQTQLDQRRRELEERHQRERPRVQPAPVAPRVPAVAPRAPVVAPLIPAAAPQDRHVGRLIAPCLFDQRDLMYLPGLTGGALRIPGVYHVYSRAEVPERQGFSCGFHALYNMIKMERRICNRRIDDHVFIDACHRIANDPHGWSTTDESAAIARRIGLPHVHNLLYEHGRVEVFFDTGTEYVYERGQNEQQAYQRAHAQRVGQFWQNLRRMLDQARGPLCIHFSCNIMSYAVDDRDRDQGEEHAVLVTLARMANGSTALYIFDNMNDQENNVSQNQICAHVMHIYQQLLG